MAALMVRLIDSSLHDPHCVCCGLSECATPVTAAVVMGLSLTVRSTVRRHTYPAAYHHIQPSLLLLHLFSTDRAAAAEQCSNSTHEDACC
jgi:hypothetical protein